MKPSKTVIKAVLFTLGAIAVLNNVAAAEPVRKIIFK